MLPTTVPQRIAIMKKHLSIAEDVEFGRKCGMSKSVVNQLISGQIKSIAPRYAYKLQDETGFSARWIMLGDPPERIEATERLRVANGTTTEPTGQPQRADYDMDWETEALLHYFGGLSNEHRADLVAQAEAWYLRDNPAAIALQRPTDNELQGKKKRRM